MTPIFQLSDDHVTREAELDPVGATHRGIAVDPADTTDYSPDGWAARAEHVKATLATLATLTPENDADRIAGAHLEERLEALDAWNELGEPFRTVQAHFGLVSNLRDNVDMLPRGTDDDWHGIAARLSNAPVMLAAWRQSLEYGRARGLVAARRQALELATQADRYVGVHDGLAESYGDGKHADALRVGIDAAHRGYAELARYLREEYAPHAVEADGVGAERYAVGARMSLGADLDAPEAYEWGWEELHRIEAELAAEANEVQAGASVSEAMAVLDAEYSVEGVDAYLDWLRARHDEALAQVDAHFDLRDELRTLEVTIAHGSAAGAPYYTGPADDGSRPGRTWWPLGGRERFSVWRELTTVFHEGVPGHHLQTGTARLLKDQVSRYARSRSVSGHGEGWALYAERLSDELGWFTIPGSRLGMLAASAMRAARVVIDIGSHLDLPLPDGSRWDYDKACEVLNQRGLAEWHRVPAEVVRYFGWPGQAISYKLGERAWLRAREEAAARPGFTLRDWHAKVLAIGPVGLSALSSSFQGAAFDPANGS